MSPVGTPVVRMHLDVRGTECICHRADGCGGVNSPVSDCPEHGLNADPLNMTFHTHALQVDRISVGTLAL